ncbi:LysR family transcriptional regulator [Chitinophaga varians]|uniref:LysR family transcriptional regulator n=1 Tax=Chitinophaga varians TaxID=2202339 RepID=UPI00165FB74E|nr:LysR family transcriptional regulator [Chitinophaga varians]MBC9909578.1 LysR family transcriptional regulator [Chitinophaga varians]
MITSNDLQLVAHIVAEGSLTKAADKMYLTQSALSHQLKDLEKRAGLPMFERVNKKLLLTAAGRRVMESANNVLPQLTRLQEDIQAYRQGKLQTLRISTECYTCYHWLPRVITELKSRHQQVEISIVAAATQKPLSWLMNGELDVAIISDDTPPPGVHTHTLFHDEVVVVLPRKHPFVGQKKSLAAADFATEHLLTYDVAEEAGTHSMMKEFFRESRPKEITRLQLTEAIVEMIQAGMGIGIFATWAIAPYLKNRDLVTLPLHTPMRKRTWKAACIDQHNPLIRQFAEHIRQYFKAADQKRSK